MHYAKKEKGGFPMLHELQAVRFDRRMSVGRTGPCLLSAIRPDGSEVEVVAKFSYGCDRGIGSLVCEAVAAMLAADLDLPVPEPFLVRIDADFVNHFPTALRETAVKLRSSSPLAFGSARLPSGYAVVAPGKPIPGDRRSESFSLPLRSSARVVRGWRRGTRRAGSDSRN